MIITIAGHSGSGKSTFAELKQKELNNDAVIIGMDNFYFGKQRLFRTSNWADNPAYCDINRLIHCITQLRKGEPTLIPQFSPVLQDRTQDVVVQPRNHIIVDGLWTLTFAQLREISDQKYFVDAPLKTRLSRRVVRDVNKGWSGKETENRAFLVESLGSRFIEPYKQYANFIVKF